MIFRVKDMGIATGGPLIATINKRDAEELDLHYGDRVSILTQHHTIVAIINIADGHAVQSGMIGLYEEVMKKLNVRSNSKVSTRLEERPSSLAFIKKKLEGRALSSDELDQLVTDIVKNRLSDIELAYFVAACHLRSMSNYETISLTKAMINTGDILKLRRKVVADKHCTGGVAGNRTTMMVVPICVAAGITMPKTSSRSITSPAGTADTMEVLAKVDFTLKKMKSIVENVGGCIVWGGAINLAPADDRIIRVEHPLSIDSRSQLLASIMAKKASVSATHLLVDIPVDPFGKISTRARAQSLKKDFMSIGMQLGIKTNVVITDGSHPIGHGLGPQLEARDVLWVLMGDERGPEDLRKKSLKLAGIILEMAGKAKKGKGMKKAEALLESGEAYRKMLEMIKAQGGKKPNPEKLHKARFSLEVKASYSGKLTHLNNSILSKIARIAGAPQDKGAGIYMHHSLGSNVGKTQPVYTVFSNNQRRLGYAEDIVKAAKGFRVR
ncbi:MAG: AMP phosphorylase [Nanoarchaeota archaeon]|nr:AMP phosphorylase [Nanoarchaeota archaeon]